MLTLDALYKTRHYATEESAQKDADRLQSGDTDWHYSIGESLKGWHILIHDENWDFVGYWEQPR